MKSVRHFGHLLCILLSPMLSSFCMAEESGKSLELFGRSAAIPLTFQLHQADWRWLKNKRVLKFGIAALPDVAPYEITSSGRYYEGLNADYIDLITKALKIDVSVQLYSSPQAALEALANGEVDIVNRAERDTPLQRDSWAQETHSYVASRRVQVSTQKENKKIASGAPLNVAKFMVFPSDADILKLYPGSHIRSYPSFQSALSAVALGQEDVFVGDVLAINYLLGTSAFDALTITRFLPTEPLSLNFLIRRQDQSLLRSINTVIEAVPESEKNRIFERWSLGASVLNNQEIAFTPEEKQWMQQHRSVKVAVSGLLPPLSFFDTDGQYQGISRDLLNIVRLRTGINIDVERVDTIEQQIQQLKDGKSDIGATALNNKNIEFTVPYVLSPVALASKINSSIDLNHMQGRSLAVFFNCSNRDLI